MSHRAYVVRLWCGCYLCQRGHGTTELPHAMRFKRIEAVRAAEDHHGATVERASEARQHPWCQYREERRA